MLEHLFGILRLRLFVHYCCFESLHLVLKLVYFVPQFANLALKRSFLALRVLQTSFEGSSLKLESLLGFFEVKSRSLGVLVVLLLCGGFLVGPNPEGFSLLLGLVQQSVGLE